MRCQYCKTVGHEIDVCQAPDADGLVRASRSRFFNQESEWIGKPWLYTSNWTESLEEEEEAVQPYEVTITGIDVKPDIKRNIQVAMSNV